MGDEKKISGLPQLFGKKPKAKPQPPKAIPFTLPVLPQSKPKNVPSARDTSKTPSLPSIVPKKVVKVDEPNDAELVRRKRQQQLKR